MTFKQRIIIAFSIVLFLPSILFMLSFFVIGNMMVDNEGAGHYFDYSVLTEDVRQNSELLDDIYAQIQEDLEEDPAIIESPDYAVALRAGRFHQLLYPCAQGGGAVLHGK